MGTPRFTPEFKEEAVRQITERGYSVAEVSDRLGVSAHSLYKWLRAIKPDNSEQHARDLLEAKSEILKLRAQLKRTEEGVSLDIENYCTLRLFFDLSILAGLSRRNLPEAGIRLLFHI